MRRDFSAVSTKRNSSTEDVRFDALTCTVTPLSQQSDGDLETGKGDDNNMEGVNMSPQLADNGGSMHNMMAAAGDFVSLSSTSTTGEDRPVLLFTGEASAGQVKLEDRDPGQVKLEDRDPGQVKLEGRDPGNLLGPAESTAADNGEGLEGASSP